MKDFYLKLIKAIRELPDPIEIYLWHYISALLGSVVLFIQNRDADVFLEAIMVATVTGAINIVGYLKSKADYEANNLDNSKKTE